MVRNVRKVKGACMVAAFLAVVIGVLVFGNFAWYANGGPWFVNLIVQGLLLLAIIVVFFGYNGQKYEKWTFLQSSYWNVRRGIQGAVLLATAATLVVMALRLK